MEHSGFAKRRASFRALSSANPSSSTKFLFDDLNLIQKNWQNKILVIVML